MRCKHCGANIRWSPESNSFVAVSCEHDPENVGGWCRREWLDEDDCNCEQCTKPQFETVIGKLR